MTNDLILYFTSSSNRYWIVRCGCSSGRSRSPCPPPIPMEVVLLVQLLEAPMIHVAKALDVQQTGSRRTRRLDRHREYIEVEPIIHQGYHGRRANENITVISGNKNLIISITANCFDFGSRYPTFKLSIQLQMHHNI